MAQPDKFYKLFTHGINGANVIISRNRSRITVYDILLCAAILFLCFLLVIAPKNDGSHVVIMVDGEKFGEYSLFGYKIVDVKSSLGYNRVVIDNGGVFVSEASCPNKLDVLRGRIDGAGESIVCIPNKVIVYIVGGSGVDSVSY